MFAPTVGQEWETRTGTSSDMIFFKKKQAPCAYFPLQTTVKAAPQLPVRPTVLTREQKNMGNTQAPETNHNYATRTPLRLRVPVDGA